MKHRKDQCTSLGILQINTRITMTKCFCFRMSEYHKKVQATLCLDSIVNMTSQLPDQYHLSHSTHP